MRQCSSVCTCKVQGFVLALCRSLQHVPAGSRSHSWGLDCSRVEVEVVVNDDVESISGKVANDIQEAGVDTVIGQISIALAIIEAFWRCSLQFSSI